MSEVPPLERLKKVMESVESDKFTYNISGKKIPVHSTFRITEDQYKKYKEWHDKLPKKYQKLDPTWQFRYNGIAYNVYAVLGGKILDVSDYENW
jgi:hypothetical protein